ncbi:hypothetical protein Y032_0368g54 [Ancylostoma ceylanicum]|uniref:Uncharacterized protein n=1 Tax=Ancylostoma ceylanicum TaxID=53326 RepID=A0A016RVR3_9BILA|nr:hypothetical protein Y032_0368g54 [Ancylostoma ceylanicum]
MDVENAKIVDGLIFGYLSRQQYHDTLRALCNEAPSLRDGRNRFQSGADVFIQVSDQLHDKNLEQIVHAFSTVGRFDVSPELIDFGVRLRDLTNEFSTMTAMRGRSLSDNQMKLYGKRAYSKMHPNRQAPSNASLRCDTVQPATYRPTVYCMAPNSNETEYVRQLHDNAVSASIEHGVPQQSNTSQQDLSYDYQSQQHVTSPFPMPSSSPYVAQAVVQSSTASTIQETSTQDTPSYQVSQILPSAQPSGVSEEPMLVDYGVNVKNTENMEIPRDVATNSADHSSTLVEDRQDGSRAQMSSSFSSEAGAHKRKAAVPHRRGEMVAHTAQSLIVPNGVLLDLEAEAAARTTSVGLVDQVSLLSNIDDSAMQCLDRLINGNLDEVFPFCDDHDGLSEFAAGLENPYPPNESNDNETEQDSGAVYEETVPPPLDVGPSHSPPPQEPSAKSRSFDDGEIISDESNHAKTPKTASAENIATRVNERESTPPAARNDSRRSSLDSGRSRRDDKKIADRLREFNRNPPKSDSRKSNTERSELRDTSAQEARNIPRSSPTPTSGSRAPRDRIRRLSALFDEGHSAPSSRDSSPHRERLNKKEEERRRREKEMEKERQHLNGCCLLRALLIFRNFFLILCLSLPSVHDLFRREREAQRERERSHRSSPERKTSDKRSRRDDEEDKPRDSKEKERKREQTEERKVMDEAEKRKAEEKARREMMKKKKEEELEAKRQAELQRRAEAMRRKEEENRRKEEENRRRRQEERERQEERRREEQRQKEEERLRREEEKRKEEERRREEEIRKAAEEEERKERSNDEEEEVETAKSDNEEDDEQRDSDDDAASDDNHTARNYSDDEEVPSKKDSITHEQWVHPRKIEQKRSGDASVSRSVENEPQQESDQDAAPPVENEERKRKNARDEHRPLRSSSDIRKNLPLPSVPSRRRDDAKKVPAKPLEPGMMMSDPGVLDRINKEMESLTPRNRSSHNRSPEESATSSKSATSSTRVAKRDAPVDYAQVLFSNAPVIKRTPPAVEKKRNLVISSGLTTDNPNQLVFSKAHSSRRTFPILVMF